MAHVKTTLGSLGCEVVQDGDARPELIVVLCHGYGAGGGDLVGLAPFVMRQLPELAGKLRFVFPEAPLSLESLGMWGARAWWPLDMERLMREPERLRDEMPEGLPKARRMLTSLVEEVTQQASLPLSRVVLGGFSQGAMLATDVALRLEEAVAGLAIMSGTLISKSEWEKRAPMRNGLKVFQSHGRQDPLLRFAGAEELRDLLTSAGLSVRFVPFDDGHTIAPEALKGLGEFLRVSQGLGFAGEI
jgi:phospholipase/carboxylesterase